MQKEKRKENGELQAQYLVLKVSKIIRGTASTCEALGSIPTCSYTQIKTERYSMAEPQPQEVIYYSLVSGTTVLLSRTLRKLELA